MSTLEGFHTHRRSAWWIKWSCLFVHMEPKPRYTLKQLWADSEPAISKKTTTSYDVQANDIQRAVAAIQRFPSPIPPDSPFLRALGTPAALKAPPQTDTLSQRALEKWERTEETVDRLDDGLLEQLSSEGIGFTDSSTMYIATAIVQLSYTELTHCLVSF